MESLSEIRAHVNQKLAELEAITSAYRREREEGERLLAESVDLKEALTICQTVAQTVQETAHAQIADIVSRSLVAVFDRPYAFKIHWEQKRGRTEARMVFARDGMEVDPMSASGGGVVDVAAFALRLSCLLLANPPRRRLLVLDEPFRFVSPTYRENVRTLMELLAKELKCQFIMVTHMDELKAGKMVQL